MEIDEKPTVEVSDIGGLSIFLFKLDKQIEEISEAIILPISQKSKHKENPN